MGFFGARLRALSPFLLHAIGMVFALLCNIGTMLLQILANTHIVRVFIYLFRRAHVV